MRKSRQWRRQRLCKQWLKPPVVEPETPQVFSPDEEPPVAEVVEEPVVEQPVAEPEPEPVEEKSAVSPASVAAEWQAAQPVTPAPTAQAGPTRQQPAAQYGRPAPAQGGPMGVLPPRMAALWPPRSRARALWASGPCSGRSLRASSAWRGRPPRRTEALWASGAQRRQGTSPAACHGRCHSPANGKGTGQQLRPQQEELYQAA